MKRYSLHIPADLSITSAIRNIAACIFEEIGFSKTHSSRLKVIFDEIYMNAVKYGSVEGGTIYITFEFENNILRVCFEDEGGDTKLSAEELEEIINYQKSNQDPTKTSGRGLAQITHMWADDLQVWNGKKGGLCIAFTKRLSDSEEDEIESEEKEMLPKDPFHHIPEGLPITRVQLKGEIDNVNIEEKVKSVESIMKVLKKPMLLILDLKELSFCNSTFLAKLATWKAKTVQYKGDIVLENVQRGILEILELVGITQLIHVSTDAYSVNQK